MLSLLCSLRQLLQFIVIHFTSILLIYQFKKERKEESFKKETEPRFFLLLLII